MPTIHFTATCSTGDITLYSWDLGDSSTDTGEDIFHNYINPGSYVVTLTVSGPSGTSVAITTITTGTNESGDAAATPVSSTTAQGEDPQVMLRMSNDGGRTWPHPEKWRAAGKIGEYNRRIRWDGLGSARRRVFEVVTSDPVPWRLVGADLEAE